MKQQWLIERIGYNTTAVWLVIASLVAYLSFNTWVSYKTYEKNASDRVLSLVRLVEQHASAKIERVNAELLEALDDVHVDDFSLGMHLPESRKQFIQEVLYKKQERTPGIVAMSVVDKDGLVFANSLGTAIGTDVSHRKYFLDLKSNPAAQLAISEVVKGLVSNKWGILLARRINLADGSFGGVIVTNLGLSENFESFYGSINLGRDDAISLRDEKNQVLVRHPVLEGALGKVITGQASARQITLKQSESVVVSKSVVDGIERFTAIRKLPDYPVFAIVGLGRNATLSGWYRELLITVLVAMSSLGVGLILTRSIRQRMQADSELRIAAATFESQEGMMVTDAHGVILKVNLAFTDTTGYSAEEAIGQNPRILQSGRHDKEFYRAMWECIGRTGSWQGEVWDKRKDGEIYPKWLTISVVKDAVGKITHFIGTHYDITERKKAEEKIRELAFFDQLTGLPNRTLLLDRLRQAMTAGARSGKNGALLFIDLDKFKTLNDTHGHEMGDLLLKQVAQRLLGCVRAEDTVARLGGDEFVVMLTGLSTTASEAAAQAELVGGMILSTLNQPYNLHAVKHHSTPSIGVTLFGDSPDDIDELMKQADLAMYKAKASGRNALRFFDPEMESTVMERAALEQDLRTAITEKQFVLHYQAQITSQGHLTGAEVLLRWSHRLRGMVSPASFIPLAEDTGLILPLGQWVLETACMQLAEWANQPDLAHLTLAVNVSAKQFHQNDFVDLVLGTLKKTGADPKRLKLELTESLLVDNIQDIIVKMIALKNVGISFSLDDFGTGYSSLAYLKRLPLDQLKIDQSFVRDVLDDSNDAAIARTIVMLAKSLGLSVIAEGVETELQRDFLLRSDCHAYQGYFFSRPLPLKAFEQFALNRPAPVEHTSLLNQEPLPHVQQAQAVDWTSENRSPINSKP
ncbi:MAG: EAL domain-containing protein [Rhodoferax sp.]|nr:EAL domain-containing protein [Rhodoferax sp.]